MADLDALASGAKLFQKAVAKVQRDSKTASTDSLRIKLQRKYPDIKQELEAIYIHPGRVEGQTVLEAHVPKRVLERAAEDGAAIFGTEHPRKHWIVTSSGVWSDFCISIDIESTTFHVYQLDRIGEEELCRLLN